MSKRMPSPPLSRRCAYLALCSSLVLSACGQRGPLYLPEDAQAQERATLPETLRPNLPANKSHGQ